ncbi:MAG: BamA/TamA family outer membrane protein [candidate division Zixibacteria bacterium]
MDLKKEIFWGAIWGIAFAVLFGLLLVSNSWSMEAPGDDGDIEVSISADTIRIELEKDGEVKTIAVDRDGYTKTASGIYVENEILIEDGKIFIDGIELTEDELDRLSIDSEENEIETGIKFGRHDKRVIKRRRLATIYTDTNDDVVKFGDLIIEEDERVNGDVVSIGGDVSIYGEVMGDVVALFGDVFLMEDSYVAGDAVSPLGSVHRDDGAVVGGDAVSVRKLDGKEHKASLGMGMRFNRVEGFTIIPGLRYESKRGEYPTLDLEAAYPFTLKRWEYDLGVSHKLGERWGPKFFGSMYRYVQSSDYWLIPWQAENSIAALFFKEDFFDYYWMRGFTGGGGLWYDDYLDLDISYTGVKIETLEKTAEKALFGGKKKFRENWSTILPDSAAILGMEGNLKELGISATYDTRDDEDDPATGIIANLSLAQTLDSDSADFDYSMVNAEVKWYYPLSSDQTFFARLRGGYSDDDLPLFRRYFIGGLGSLRGYEYKEFEGNRYVLFNADYIWRFFESDFGAGLFFDIGKAGFNENGFESSDFKSDVGLSFMVSDVIRLNLAQRLDDIDKSPVFSVRGKILF